MPPTSTTSKTAANKPNTTTKQQRIDYGIERWGRDYFSINEQGNISVHPTRDPTCSFDLKQLVDDLRSRDFHPPLLIRFPQIIRDRMEALHEAFDSAITEFAYEGQYRGVYPIKVNQQRHVVEEVLNCGKQYHYGLEAGSKPELLAVLAMTDGNDTPIICNGFKDDEFIEAVILATKMGKRVIPVVEKLSELALIVKYANLHQVQPMIGIRIKIAAAGTGRWSNSSGERSKFGLFFNEALEAFEYLKQNNMADCLQLLHAHLGSQINDIQCIKRGLLELSRVYVEFHKLGAGLKYLDIGGGLGVDYDGSKTNTESSTNYALQEYANDVIYHIKDICEQTNTPHPIILAESGRALVAYHSVLIFNVLGVSSFDRFDVPSEISQDAPSPVKELFDIHINITKTNFIEYYHDTVAARHQVLNLFNLGYCSLPDRAISEQLYYSICAKVRRFASTLETVPKDIKVLDQLLCDTYFCNFSLFQSLPDSWAIDHLFPIMPIHRLNEKPSNQAILADITCDSDGKIDHFIGEHQPDRTLLLHPYTGEDYYLGAFLVGAYQEILGDMHNLFGDTHAVHVSIDENNEPIIEEVIEGDTVREVLAYVQYDAKDLKRTMRLRVEKALREHMLTLAESRQLLKFYESGLEGYTYLE